MDRNKASYFENLSFLLLSKIVNHIDNNIDRLVLPLVCKRWFENRDSYLTFNSKNLPKNQTFDHKQCNLYSFKSQFEKAITTKSVENLFITDHEEFLYNSHLTRQFIANSYIINTELNDEDHFEIPNSVVNALIFIVDGMAGKLERFIKSIENSNISNLKIVNSFYQPLPPLPLNITSLHLGSFSSEYTEELQVGTFPPSLRKLVFQGDYSHKLVPGVLPDLLEELVLPNLTGGDLEVGVLPSGLKSLQFGTEGYKGTITRDLLPNTLKTLKEFPVKYLELIPPSVKVLSLVCTSEQQQTESKLLLPGDIPDSVTELHLCEYSHTLTPGLLPNSLKSLYLFTYLHSLQPNTLPDGLKKLVIYTGGPYEESIQPGVLPLTLKKLRLYSRFNGTITSGSLPNGLEKLVVLTDTSESTIFEKASIPNTVKNLIFNSNSIEPGTIPNFVETINMEGYTEELHESTLPPSVTTISLAYGFFRKNTLKSIPSTVKNIIVRTYPDNYHLKRIERSNGPNSIDHDYFLVLQEIDETETFRGGFMYDESYFKDDLNPRKFIYEEELKYHYLYEPKSNYQNYCHY